MFWDFKGWYNWVHQKYEQSSGESNAAAKNVNDDIVRSISDKLRNFENIIENLAKVKEEDSGTKTKRQEKEEIATKSNLKKKNYSSGKHKLTWLGTSLSKGLDKEKFEKDANVDLTIEKAFCIKDEGRFKDRNFSAILPEIVKKGDVDTSAVKTGLFWVILTKDQI